MIPHWTERRDDLRTWLTTNRSLLIGLDFDGTLAPIMPHPQDVYLSEETRAALYCLTKVPGVHVAVISGRSLRDLISRVHVEGILYAGNHGLEMHTADGQPVQIPGSTGSEQEALSDVLLALTPELAHIPGVWVEDKQLTASVHYRQADEVDHARIGQTVQYALQGISSLVLQPGKLIWEIRPALEWHKGSALATFVTHCKVQPQATAFMGDDRTDNDAFKILGDGWTFFVGENAPEGVKVRLNDPQDTTQLIEWIADVRSGVGEQKAEA